MNNHIDKNCIIFKMINNKKQKIIKYNKLINFH